MKKMSGVKATVAKMGEHLACNSVGKSIPYFFYEPKVPAALKDKMERTANKIVVREFY